MTDRELLEAAAKAAGIGLMWSSVADISPRNCVTLDSWNPLTDDGDALLLAVKLKLDVSWWRTSVVVQTDLVQTDDKKSSSGFVPYGGDAAAALRRAIVRAAAAIGAKVKP